MSCLSHHHHHQLHVHVHSYTITPCSISNITPQQTCTRWTTFQLSIPYYRSSSSLSLRSDKTCCCHHFHFPLHKRKRPRSTFTSLLNFLPFYMFNLLSIHIKLYRYAIPSYPFSFHLLFFQSLKSRGRSSLSKGSMLGTVAYASRPRKFIPLHTLAAP